MADSMLIGAINNGVYKKTAASQEATKSNETTSTSKTAGKTGTDYNQEMFLQLLVAEMQYQDPLEPTDNGQYVAQLASFTQIEAIQSVQKDMASIEAHSLVGKYVVINDNNTEVRGKVNYVTADDDGTLYVNVNEKTYKVEDIDSVVDEAYYTAVTMVEAFNAQMAKLPSVENVTLGDEQLITDAVNIFNAMDSYTQSFIPQETKDLLTKIAARFDELKKAKEEADKLAEEEANKLKEAEELKAEETEEVEDVENTDTSAEETVVAPAVEETNEEQAEEAAGENEGTEGLNVEEV